MAEIKMPLYVVTGFLGAGKTRLMQAWARMLPRGEAYFVVSEFGTGGVDQVVLGSSADVSWSDGCVCCTGYAATLTALERLAMRTRKEQRSAEIFLETSGASDLSVLLFELANDLRFRRYFDLRSIVTLIDCAGAIEMRAAFLEWRSQVASADIVALTHVDALSPSERAGRIARVRELINVRRPSRLMVAPSPEFLLAEMRASAPADRLARVAAVVGEADRDRHPGLRFTSLPFRSPQNLSRILAFADALVCLAPSLLRLKMLVPSPDSSTEFYLVQIVSGRLQQPETVSVAPNDNSGSIYAIDNTLGSREIESMSDLFFE